MARELGLLFPKVRRFKSEKEIAMKSNKTTKTGTTRRGFISQTGLLIAGSVLASSSPEESSAAGAGLQTLGPPPPQDVPTLRADLVTANRILYDQGVVDGYGHVSVRHPTDPNHFLISRWLAPDMVTEGDILELDFDCKPVTGEKVHLYSEVFIHGEVYRARPDVKSIVHTHAPAVILMGISGEPLMPMYQMTGYMGSGVPVFDIRNAIGMTNMLVSDPTRGKALVKTLADNPAVLMRGHGGVVTGNSLYQVVGRSVYMKVNAELQIQVLGKKVTFLAPEEAKLTSNADYPKDWEMWKRKVAGQRA
jgi:ribulose-5-phosphate 4-epimerase/fuculose-1-phosphate aldolase